MKHEFIHLRSNETKYYKSKSLTVASVDGLEYEYRMRFENSNNKIKDVIIIIINYYYKLLLLSIKCTNLLLMTEIGIEI